MAGGWKWGQPCPEQNTFYNSLTLPTRCDFQQRPAKQSVCSASLPHLFSVPHGATDSGSIACSVPTSRQQYRVALVTGSSEDAGKYGKDAFDSCSNRPCSPQLRSKLRRVLSLMRLPAAAHWASFIVCRVGIIVQVCVAGNKQQTCFPGAHSVFIL